MSTPVSPTIPAPTGSPYRLSFVCLGNICRSPTAAVVMTQLVDEVGLAAKVEVASCGTGGWHVGEPIDPRAGTRLLAEGYDASGHRARQVDPDWLQHDLVLAMDRQNLHDLTDGRGADDRVRLFRSFDPLVGAGGPPADDDLDVPDPWYVGEAGFVEVFHIVERTCRALVAELEALHL